MSEPARATILRIIPAGRGWRVGLRSEISEPIREAGGYWYEHGAPVCLALIEYGDGEGAWRDVVGVRQWDKSESHNHQDFRHSADLECGGDCDGRHWQAVPRTKSAS
jgi:hypothetical protein